MPWFWKVLFEAIHNYLFTACALQTKCQVEQFIDSRHTLTVDHRLFVWYPITVPFSTAELIYVISLCLPALSPLFSVWGSRGNWIHVPNIDYPSLGAREAVFLPHWWQTLPMWLILAHKCEQKWDMSLLGRSWRNQHLIHHIPFSSAKSKRDALNRSCSVSLSPRVKMTKSK